MASSDDTNVGYKVHIDRALCTSCGLCEAFCPVNVFEMNDGPQAVRPEDCWGCETCAGQCPVHAIRIEASPAAKAAFEEREVAAPLDPEIKARYRE